jgi:hypothetical protein
MRGVVMAKSPKCTMSGFVFHHKVALREAQRGVLKVTDRLPPVNLRADNGA